MLTALMWLRDHLAEQRRIRAMGRDYLRKIGKEQNYYAPPVRRMEGFRRTPRG